tara:strand:+ start:75 stop:269 length:195 start_codon:yes stop_codon:yes gene_type:complete
MENELTDPAFNNTPQAPEKWQVIVWCLCIVVAVTTEVVRHKIKKEIDVKSEVKKVKKSENKHVH